MFRLFEPCRVGDCSDCRGTLAQLPERASQDALITVDCNHECHDAERDEKGGEG